MYRLSFILAALPLQAQNALYVDLSGAWRLQAGDDPSYAQPSLDDSEWRTIPVPLAWTGSPTQSIPGNPRIYWLRRRVELPAGTDRTRLALTLGAIHDGYEVYVDGKLASTTGSFDALETAHLPQPRTFALPPVAGPSLQLALRVHRKIALPPSWRLADQGPYLLTYQGQMAVDYGTAQFRQRYEELSLGLVFGTILLSIACLSFFAWTTDRSRHELFWFALAAITHGAGSEFFRLSQLSISAQPIDRWGATTVQVVLSSLVWPLLGEFTIVSFEPPKRALWRTALWALFAFSCTVVFGISYFWWCAALTGGLLLLMVAVCWYRDSAEKYSFESWIASLAIGILALFHTEDFGRRMLGVPNWIPVSFAAGSYRVERNQVLFTTLALVILITVLRRTAADRREKQRMASEFEAARVIQRLLLDQAQLRDSGFVLEAVYAPAQEVGGDFYYVLDGQTIVVGDVSGKGLKAAMLVSLAIGALRNSADRRPGALLSALSRAVAGQMEGGFITCVCARLDADGRLTVANAGHLAPYLDGVEAEVETGLPLGLDPDALYAETALALRPGSTLTLVSDGVVEAENAQRELFGFERTREISGKTAQEIAEAAKAWGQNDDITVVTVRREES